MQGQAFWPPQQPQVVYVQVPVQQFQQEGHQSISETLPREQEQPSGTGSSPVSSRQTERLEEDGSETSKEAKRMQDQKEFIDNTLEHYTSGTLTSDYSTAGAQQATLHATKRHAGIDGGCRVCHA